MRFLAFLGGMYGLGISALRSRLLPLLGSAYFGTSGVTAEASLAVLAKEREVCTGAQYRRQLLIANSML